MKAPISKPTTLTAKIQSSAKARPRVVHIDKLKHHAGKTPKPWVLPVETDPEEARSLDEEQREARLLTEPLSVEGVLTSSELWRTLVPCSPLQNGRLKMIAPEQSRRKGPTWKNIV